MALKGTLKDFGIADILQLIGQQQKTGTLYLKNKEQEVQIGFKDGSIVKAETSTRRKKELIGAMLVRAELITEQQLEEALETQRRTLKRLGDVLVNAKVITRTKFREMCQLQASETLYALFQWSAGTYAFEQGEVDHDPEAVAPMRAESVLMEGFRMVDEWPQIRRRITGYDMTFEKLKALPPPVAPEKEVEADLEDAFSEEPRAERKGDFQSIGESERRVFALIVPHRDVRTLIDLSCVGEFETCKALCNLINLDYLKPFATSRNVQKIGKQVTPRDRMITVGAWVLSVGVVLTLLGLLVTTARLGSWELGGGTAGALAKLDLQHHLAKTQVARISAALDVYRLEKGDFPKELRQLVEMGLLSADDLRYPWKESYYYRRVDAQGFVLLPPFR